MSPWESSLVRFVDDCAESRITEPVAALHCFAELRDCAPSEFAGLFDRFPSRDRLQKLIEEEAFLTAAMEMIGPYCGILITRSGEGSSSALVTISREVDEGNFFCDDPAIALLGAFSRSLLALGNNPKSVWNAGEAN